MRSPRIAAVIGALAGLALMACEGAGMLPPPDPVRVSLQQGDVPAEFGRCPGSGAVDGYLRELRSAGPAAHDELQAAWRDAQSRGAAAGAVSVYASQPAACTARLGTGDGPSVSTVVVSFRGEAAAAAQYRHGMLGFTTPSEDREVAGLTRGPATGAGRNSWVLERSVRGRALIVGYWERDAVVVLFVAVDADPLRAKQALSAVDRRIG